MCWTRKREESVSLEDGCEELQRDDPNVNDYLEDPTSLDLVVIIVMILCAFMSFWAMWSLFQIVVFTLQYYYPDAVEDSTGCRSQHLTGPNTL